METQTAEKLTEAEHIYESIWVVWMQYLFCVCVCMCTHQSQDHDSLCITVFSNVRL